MADYNVQCISGHVFQAPRGSKLEARCISRVKSGFLDALCVTEEDCPECMLEAEDRRIEQARADQLFPFVPGPDSLDV